MQKRRLGTEVSDGYAASREAIMHRQRGSAEPDQPMT
jgi:ribosomal protein L27